MFYRWQKESFENGAAAFQSKQRPAVQVGAKQKRIEFLEKKVQTKDEVLAKLMAEHITLKKVLGSFDQGVGSPMCGTKCSALVRKAGDRRRAIRPLVGRTGQQVLRLAGALRARE